MESKTYFDDGHNCTAIEYTDNHVYVKVCFLDEDGDYGYVDFIGVDEGFRGQGIGTSAIKEIVKDYFALYFAPTNEDNARLYDRLGEKVVGEDITTGVRFECLYNLDQGFGVYEVA